MTRPRKRVTKRMSLWKRFCRWVVVETWYQECLGIDPYDAYDQEQAAIEAERSRP